MKELSMIQTELVAPKGKKNGFAGYDFRNLEDICEAVKPLLKKYSCSLTFDDQLTPMEGRFFMKSIATITNEKGEQVSATGWAEIDVHKGMSKEQNTGSASSYARKYAACSLLAIDDNRDVDSMEPTDAPAQKPEKPAKPAAEKPKVKKITMKDTAIIEKCIKWSKEHRAKDSWLSYTKFCADAGKAIEFDMESRNHIEKEMLQYADEF